MKQDASESSVAVLHIATVAGNALGTQRFSLPQLLVEDIRKI